MSHSARTALPPPAATRFGAPPLPARAVSPCSRRFKAFINQRRPSYQRGLNLFWRPAAPPLANWLADWLAGSAESNLGPAGVDLRACRGVGVVSAS